MSDIKGLLTQPGLTNAQAYLLNWIMLAFVVVEWTVCFFIADEGLATRRSLRESMRAPSSLLRTSSDWCAPECRWKGNGRGW